MPQLTVRTSARQGTNLGFTWRHLGFTRELLGFDFYTGDQDKLLTHARQPVESAVGPV